MIIPELWQFIEMYVFLFLLLGGLFIPMYVVGKNTGKKSCQYIGALKRSQGAITSAPLLIYGYDPVEVF